MLTGIDGYATENNSFECRSFVQFDKMFLPYRKDEILVLAYFEANNMQFITYENYKNERVTARHSMIQSGTYIHENHRSLNL
ncbi:MAG: hypothetical protein CVV33_04690 [Methanomicrobiales archaeon HGW-Methanomicrobiales-4]|nr:MAG: hypothetical protein CVV33_04690 [Methanomicrobiales archaeon HGW-Methanomicrobiales-4]